MRAENEQVLMFRRLKVFRRVKIDQKHANRSSATERELQRFEISIAGSTPSADDE